NKSDVSEGFNQVIGLLNASYTKYALTINPHIYVSCIKQFWTTVIVKQSNDVTRLQALVDNKKMVITEATIRDALRLDDAEGVNCLPNKEIFAELARMDYEKPSTKLTFYKAFFSRDDVQDQSIPSPTPPTPPPQPPQDLPLISKRIDSSDDTVMEDASNQGRIIDDLDKDDAVALMEDKENEKKAEEAKVAGDDQVQGRQAKIYKINIDHASKVLIMQEDEPEVQEVVDVVTTAKLITEVVTTAIKVAAASIRIRKGVVIRDPEEESTTVIPAETKSKDKGKGIMEALDACAALSRRVEHLEYDKVA
nr:xylulose kinase-1 [Tanacetum cinerariifolium]